MKKRLNLRFISILTVLAMLLTIVPAVLAAEAEAEAETETEIKPLDGKYTEALELLKVLGAYTPEEAAGIVADTEVTRGEFTKRLMLTMNLGEAAKAVEGKTIFMDIHDSSLKGYANLAYDMGITKGTGDASFEPDEPATLYMAVSMVMRALGYIHIPNQVDLYNKASLTGVLNGVESKANLTVQDMALILYNALHTASLRVSLYEVTTQGMLPDRDWLEIWHNIAYVEGVAEATHITALKQKPVVREGNLVIDGVEIFGVPNGCEKLLGYPVRCYYDNTDERKEYEYITSYGLDYQEFTLKAADVSKLTTTSITFYNENGKPQTMSILPSADFVYNGKAESLGKHSLAEMTKNYTGVKVLDSNDDDRIDTVFITKSTTFAVSYVDTAGMKLMGKNSELAKLLYAKDNPYSIVRSDGTPVTINDIKEWNIVSITESFDKEYVRVEVSDKAVTGTAESYRTGTTCYITIDGQEYEIIKSLIDNKEIHTGKSATFYLGGDDVIYAANYSADGAGKWVWAVALKSEDAFNNVYKFGCVEGSQAEFKVYEVADRVVVDGSSVRENQLGTALKASDFPEAMIATINEEGELTRLNTLKLGQNESVDENIYKRHNGPESAEKTNDGALWYNNGSKSFHGRFIISTNSTNYAFPGYDKTAYNDMFSISYAHDEPPYAVTLYSQGTDTPVCDFSISMNLSKGGSTPGAETGAVPFLHIGQEYDAESGDVYDVLYYLNPGNAEVGVRISEDIKNIEMVYSGKAQDLDGDGTDDYTGKTKMPISRILSLLEKGDLIRISTDQNGLAGLQHVYDVSKRRLVQSQGGYCWTTATDGGSDEQRLFAGKLYEIRDDYLRIITNTSSYDPVTGTGMEVHKIKANRSQGWNRLLKISQNGEVSYSAVSGTPAFPGVKQGSDDFELVMQSTFGDAIFKIFIDYSDSTY